MASIKVFGQASGKLIKRIEVSRPIVGSLMDFLMQNKITIASSCAGAGSCKKCVVNSNLLSCQISLKEFLNDRKSAVVEVSYL